MYGGRGFVDRPHPSHLFTASHPTVYETSRAVRNETSDGWNFSG